MLSREEAVNVELLPEQSGFEYCKLPDLLRVSKLINNFQGVGVSYIKIWTGP